MSDQDDTRQLIEQQQPAIQTLTEALRQRIGAIQPNLSQDASLKLGVIYFRHNRVVCALSPHKAHVNLHFYKGKEIPDPQGILQGSGKVLRHIQYRKVEDIDDDILAQYVRAAYALNASG